MQKIIVNKIARIVKSKKKLEKELKVKIEMRGKEIYISGDPEKEYIAIKVIEALDFGFPFADALEIRGEDFIFEIMNIKDHTNKKNLERVRGRIIGKGGKALKTLSNLSECHIEILENKIGIIGESERIQGVEESLKLLINGSKHSNVYSYLEKHRIHPIIDLGLKETNTNL